MLLVHAEDPRLERARMLRYHYDPILILSILQIIWQQQSLLTLTKLTLQSLKILGHILSIGLHSDQSLQPIGKLLIKSGHVFRLINKSLFG